MDRVRATYDVVATRYVDMMVNEVDERPIERGLLDEVVIPVLSSLSSEILDSLSDLPAFWRRSGQIAWNFLKFFVKSVEWTDSRPSYE